MTTELVPVEQALRMCWHVRYDHRGNHRVPRRASVGLPHPVRDPVVVVAIAIIVRVAIERADHVGCRCGLGGCILVWGHSELQLCA